MDIFNAVIVIIAASVVPLLVWLITPSRECKIKRKVAEGTDYKQKKTLEQALEGTKTGKRYLVIGAGQVGLRIIDALVARGETHVNAFDISKPRRAYRATGAEQIVEFIRGDITKTNDVMVACKDVDVVFLTAALIRYCGIEFS
jgi:phosphoglycerate dehydrogenase-like enzyme